MSQTGPTLSGLEAGQTYSVSVRAKNTINSSGGDGSDGYGAELTDTFDTSVPSAPTLYSASSALSHSETTNSVSARPVSTTTPTIGAGNIIRLGGATGEVNFATVSNVAVNESNADLETAHHSWDVEVGGVSEGVDALITDFQAFDSPFAYAGSTEVSAGDSALTLSSHGDAGSSGTAGFWATITAQLDYTATAGESQITVELIKLVNSAETSRSKSFYGDSLTASPSVSTVTVSGSVTDSNADTVSGVPTLGDGFTLPLNVDIANVAKYFFRADKIADVDFSTHPGASDTLVVSGTSFTYAAGGSATAPFTSAAVRFAKTITFDDPGAGKWSPAGNIQVDCRPYNIVGSGSESSSTGVHTSTGVLGAADGSTYKALYIDTVSTRELASHPTEVICTGGYSGGVVDTPAMTSTASHGAYDHTALLTSGEYQQSLQFTGGTYRTAQNSDAYLDYTTYTDHPSLGALPDYSAISADSTYRYVTFQFTLASGSTISALDITFNDANGTLTSNSDGTTKANSYTKLWVKVIQDGDYTPHATNNSSSIWIDGNVPTNTAVGRSQTNYADSGLEPLAALDKDNSTSSLKRVTLATGTSTGSTGMTVLVRVGLVMNQDVQFSSVTLAAV